jgi:hypothetical protein
MSSGGKKRPNRCGSGEVTAWFNMATTKDIEEALDADWQTKPEYPDP